MERRAPSACAGQKVEGGCREGNHPCEEQQLERPPAHGAAAQVDRPVGRGGQLHGLVEGRQERLRCATQLPEPCRVELRQLVASRSNAAVGRSRDAHGGDVGAEHRRLLAVPERQPERDELRQEPGQ